MKEWVAPNIICEDIRNTSAGGGKPTVHDGFIWQKKEGERVVMVEEYFPES